MSPEEKMPYKSFVIKRALAKIKVNVWFIYENLKIKEEINKGRIKFGIPENFFVEYKIKNYSNHSTNNLHVLLGNSIISWSEKILNNEKTLAQVINNIGIKNLEVAAKKANLKIDAERKRNYAIVKINDYLNKDGNSDIYDPLRLNPRVWRLIVGAKLFEIPPETVFSCIDSMLDNYFPTVDKQMRIQFNELTSIEDIKYIWSEVEKQQRGFTEDFKLNKTNEYPNHDRDKMVYEMKKGGLTYKKIIDELSKKGYETNFNLSYIGVIIKTYKKFIN